MSGKQGAEQVSLGGDSFDTDISPKTEVLIPSSQENAVKILVNPKPKTIIEEAPHLRLLKPLHQRIVEYKAAKALIFGQVSIRIQKARERYRKRKSLRKEIMATSLFEGEDSRFYAKILIKGEEIFGLIDSGATVTCLGKDCLKFVERTGLEISLFYSFVKTAGGQQHKIVGRIKAEINFNNKTEEILVYFVPSLARSLFLGVDFMRKFGLLANISSL